MEGGEDCVWVGACLCVCVRMHACIRGGGGGCFCIGKVPLAVYWVSSQPAQYSLLLVPAVKLVSSTQELPAKTLLLHAGQHYYYIDIVHNCMVDQYLGVGSCGVYNNLLSLGPCSQPLRHSEADRLH